MTLDHNHLAAVGTALYGSNWVNDLAFALSVSERSMRRWAAGTYEIPEGIRSELVSLCKARSANLEGIARALELEQGDE